MQWLIRQAGIPRRDKKTRRDYPTPRRGMVVAVHGIDSDVQGRVSPPQLLVDVVFADGGMVRAPVMQRGSSVTNVSRWIPTPARTNVATGEPIKLVNDGLSPPVSRLEDLDGEMVVVDWLEGDINRPLVVGSLEPQAARREVRGSYPPPVVEQGQGTPLRRHQGIGERYLAHQGTTARIDEGGSVRLDLRRAGVANDGTTYDAAGAPAGIVDVAIRDGAEVVIRNQAGAPVLRVRGTAGGVQIDVGEAPDERILLGGATIEHLSAWQREIDAMGQRVSALLEYFSQAAAAANAAGAPMPVLVQPGDVGQGTLPWLWNPPGRADAEAGTLQSALVRIDPRTPG